jgi:hydroxymethylbilane synthase
LRRSRKPIRIAARSSPLARIQARMVAKGLNRLHPAVEVEFLWIESQGDRITDRALADEGGKGMFTSEVDRVVLEGGADVGVHSFKDVPVQPTPGLSLAATPKRADVRDCLIARDPAVRSIHDLPHAAVVGTSSPRRAAQLLRLRNDLNVRLLRGNVGTRLKKVLGEPDDPHAPPPAYDASLLAAAGLKRLKMTQHTDRPIDVDTVLPAASQGTIALFCRVDDHVTLTRCLPLNNAATSTAVHAERHLVAALDAECGSAIAALAEPTPPPNGQPLRNTDAHWFRFRARVLAPDGSRMLEADETVQTRELPRTIDRIAADMIRDGAKELLQSEIEIPTLP